MTELTKTQIVDALRRVEQAAFGFDDGKPVTMGFSDLRVMVSVFQNLVLEHHNAMQLIQKNCLVFRREEHQARERAKCTPEGLEDIRQAGIERADYFEQLALHCEDLLAKTLEQPS